MDATRRQFLVGGGAALGVAAIGTWSWKRMLESDAASELRVAESVGQSSLYGRLRPDPRGVLDLPEGFRYRVISQRGRAMTDGLRVPARADGMACFPLEEGRVALMRNHENPLDLYRFGAFDRAQHPANTYDPRGAGGVTRLEVELATGRVVDERLALSGTVLNCAGGTSPWGYWTCEETLDEGHGYTFLVDPTTRELKAPRPFRKMGRFRHEAACTDPHRRVTYLTEDREDGCFYRFVHREEIEDGQLQVAKIKGRDAVDTGAFRGGATSYEVIWQDIDDTGVGDLLRNRAVRERGALTVARGEGVVFVGDASKSAVVVAATIGGPSGAGQLLRFESAGNEGELRVLAEASDTRLFKMPDNLVVDDGSLESGGRLYFCEDGGGNNFIRCIDDQARVLPFARNVLSDSELAGLCFAPGRKAMFVNLQTDGLTLMIEGPFV